ncbi:phBC6A51 family helix-turn-helix protein [Fischerella thermalis]|nr:phBC6A51 family helix-turn-helix protein [Fischerella thermalis]
MSQSDDIEPKKIKAAVLLSSGFSQAKVAQELGISKRTLQRWQREPSFKSLTNSVASEVTNATIKATSEHLSEGGKPLFTYEYRKTLILKECEYLDIALNAVLPRIQEDGDLRAIDRLLRISERRCKLLGLDMPNPDILNAAIVLTEAGVIKEFQSDLVIKTMDEMTSKLAQIGVDE